MSFESSKSCWLWFLCECRFDRRCDCRLEDPPKSIEDKESLERRSEEVEWEEEVEDVDTDLPKVGVEDGKELNELLLLL